MRSAVDSLSSLRSFFLPTLLMLTGVVLGAASAEAASVTVTWNAPATNVDGSRLTDLASYRLYMGTSSPACPSGTFHTVSSPTSSPSSGQTVSSDVTGLSAGVTYFARVTAVDGAGNEGPCSAAASGVAQSDISVTPTAATSFGSIASGATVDRTFTVANTGGAALSGSASIAAPFRVVSGGSFSLNPGASAAVVVRFQPTSAGSFAGNVTFTANGDTLSRGVTGSATGSSGGPAPQPPPPPPSTSGPGLPGVPTITQLAADSTGVRFNVAWTGGSGATSYRFVAAFDDGTHVQQGGLGAALSFQLHLPYQDDGTPTGAFVCVRSVNAAGVASADQACNVMSVPARPSAPSGPVGGPPSVPGQPTVRQVAADANGVTIAVAWTAASSASAYRYVAAFVDGSGAQQGTVTGTSAQIRIPYHASGQGFGGFVCVESIGSSGQVSSDRACNALQVPARP
jgi:hypothetical protein